MNKTELFIYGAFFLILFFMGYTILFSVDWKIALGVFLLTWSRGVGEALSRKLTKYKIAAYRRRGYK